VKFLFFSACSQRYQHIAAFIVDNSVKLWKTMWKTTGKNGGGLSFPTYSSSLIVARIARYYPVTLLYKRRRPLIPQCLINAANLKSFIGYTNLQRRGQSVAVSLQALTV
jgi:hypothetical protein